MRARSIFLAGRDLGFLQRLHAGDFKLLHGPTAFQSGNVDRLLAHDVGALHLLGRDDIGFFHPPIGVGALGKDAGDFDRAVLIGDLHDFAAFDVEDVARLRRVDALAFQRQLGRDARGLDRLTALDLGFFDHLLAGDVARFGLLLGGDTFGGDPHILGDAGLLDSLACRDLGGVDCAIAGDLQ